MRKRGELAFNARTDVGDTHDRLSKHVIDHISASGSLRATRLIYVRGSTHPDTTDGAVSGLASRVCMLTGAIKLVAGCLAIPITRTNLTNAFSVKPRHMFVSASIASANL